MIVVLVFSLLRNSAASLIDYADGATADCFTCPSTGPPPDPTVPVNKDINSWTGLPYESNQFSGVNQIVQLRIDLKKVRTFQTIFIVNSVGIYQGKLDVYTGNSGSGEADYLTDDKCKGQAYQEGVFTCEATARYITLIARDLNFVNSN